MYFPRAFHMGQAMLAVMWEWSFSRFFLSNTSFSTEEKEFAQHISVMWHIPFKLLSSTYRVWPHNTCLQNPTIQKSVKYRTRRILNYLSNYNNYNADIGKCTEKCCTLDKRNVSIFLHNSQIGKYVI